MNVFSNLLIEEIIANLTDFMREKTLLLYLVKLILKEDIILIKTQMNTFSLLIYF